MRGSAMHENRETLRLPWAVAPMGRGGKSEDVIHRCTVAGSLTAP
jgi:hypothetical protein